MFHRGVVRGVVDTGDERPQTRIIIQTSQVVRDFRKLFDLSSPVPRAFVTQDERDNPA